MLTYHCGLCGSERVVFDATAEWDRDSQSWRLDGDNAVHDHSPCFCCDCERESYAEVRHSEHPVLKTEDAS